MQTRRRFLKSIAGAVAAIGGVGVAVCARQEPKVDEVDVRRALDKMQEGVVKHWQERRAKELTRIEGQFDPACYMGDFRWVNVPANPSPKIFHQTFPC